MPKRRPQKDRNRSNTYQPRKIADDLNALTARQFFRLLERDHGSPDIGCCFCDEDMNSSTVTLDHRTARVLGGRDYVSNFQLACEACNQQKAVVEVLLKLTLEFKGRMRLERLPRGVKRDLPLAMEWAVLHCPAIVSEIYQACPDVVDSPFWPHSYQEEL